MSASAIANVKPCGTCTRTFSWQFFRKSVGCAPTPTCAMYWLYETVKAVLSGATATAAVPVGQPEPLTVTTSMTMWSFGGCTSSWGTTVPANAGEVNNNVDTS